MTYAIEQDDQGVWVVLLVPDDGGEINGNVISDKPTRYGSCFRLKLFITRQRRLAEFCEIEVA